MSHAQKLQVIKNETAEKLDVIRPELNLEQWLLWQPANARDGDGKPLLEAKVLEKEITLPSGREITARVTADFSSHGSLTTEDQKTLYGLVKIWEGKGEECFKQTYFSVAQLLRALKRRRSPNAVNSLIKSLRRLRANQIQFEHSFYVAETKEWVSTIEDPITILAGLKIIRRERGGRPVRDEGYFKFHPLILKNLAANHRKPVLIDVVLSLKSDVGQLIYTYIDRQLTFDDRHRIKSENLFREIGLERDAYRYASKRKQTLDRALPELVGKALSAGGIIAKAFLEPTKDKRDFNVIFEKGARLRALPAIKTKEPSEAEQLVNYFHQVFFGASDGVRAGKRELDQATQLIAAHGFETAKAVIDCAKREAPKTNFDIKAFGGVLQYQARTLADVKASREFEERKKETEAAYARQIAADFHFQHFAPMFRTRLKEDLSEIERTRPEQFSAFRAHFEKNHAKGLRLIESEKRREEITISRAAEFFNELRPDLGVTLTTFEEWNETENEENADPVEWMNRNPAAINKLLNEEI